MKRRKITIEKQNVFIIFKHMTGKTSAGRCNYCKITLNSADLYNVEFIYCSIKENTVRATHTGIYNDMLADLFANVTGLAVRL